MTEVLRPFPDPVAPEYADHVGGLAEGSVVVRRCRDCAAVQWPPRPTCAACRGTRYEPYSVAAEGEVYTFSVVRRAFHPWFADRIPYGVAVVQLAEGVRLAGLYDGPVDTLGCGRRVIGRGVDLGGAPALVWSPEESRS